MWKLLQNEEQTLKFFWHHLIHLYMGAISCTNHIKTVLGFLPCCSIASSVVVMASFACFINWLKCLQCCTLQRTIASSCVGLCALLKVAAVSVWQQYGWTLQENDQRLVLQDRCFPQMFLVFHSSLYPTLSLSPQISCVMHELTDVTVYLFHTQFCRFAESAYPILFQ